LKLNGACHSLMMCALYQQTDESWNWVGGGFGEQMACGKPFAHGSDFKNMACFWDHPSRLTLGTYRVAVQDEFEWSFWSNPFTVSELSKVPSAVNGTIRFCGRTYTADTKRIDCNSKQVVDLRPLTKLRHLKELTLHCPELTDFTALMNLRKLEYLEVIDSPISDLSPLKGLKNLQTLRIVQALTVGQVTQVKDISPLSEIISLISLDLGGTIVQDITPLRNLKKLTSLGLTNTPVADLTPLIGLKKLSYLYIGGTQVKDLSPLKKMTTLRYLELIDTQIPKSQISNLKLTLPGCRIGQEEVPLK